MRSVIPTKSISIFVLLCIAIRFNAWGEEDTPANAHDAADRLVFHVSLEEETSGLVTGKVLLGDLPQGSDQLVKLVLENASRVPVSLRTVETSCGCIDVELTAEVIAPGGTVDAIVKVSVPKTHGNPRWLQNITFGKQGEDEMLTSISLTGTVSGMLAVSPASFSLPVARSGSIAGEMATQKIAIEVTPPVKMANLKLRGTSGVNLLDIKMIQEDEVSGTLVVEVSPEDVPEEGLHLTLFIEDSKTGAERRVTGTIFQRDAVNIAPQVVRLKRKDGRLVAKAVVISSLSAAEMTEMENDEVPTVLIKASIADKPCRVSVNVVSNWMARVTLSLKEDVYAKVAGEKEQSPSIDWDISWGKHKVRESTRTFVSQSGLK